MSITAERAIAVACEACGNVHELPATRVPRFGARVRCAACGQLFDVPPRDEVDARIDRRRLHRRRARPENGAPTPRPPASPAEPELDERHLDAQRLARMLLTDVLYADTERLAEARRNGRVLSDFRKEIAGALAFYKKRVGSEISEETPYFRQAVHEILATRED